MKKRIVSIFLSLIICSTVVLQPKIIKADPLSNVFGGGVLFLLLTTALGHAGYQIESEDSANYIYNFFFKKYGISDQELKAIAEDNGANMLSWEDFQKKLTTPLDSNYPDLKDVFYKKTTSVGVKIGIKATDSFKRALDQLVEDLPTSIVTEIVECNQVMHVNNFPVSLEANFPIVQRPKDDITTFCITSPILYFDVENPTNDYQSLVYSVVPNSWVNTKPYRFGQAFDHIPPNSKVTMELVGFSQPRNLDYYNYLSLRIQGENVSDEFPYDMTFPYTHSNNFTFSIDTSTSDKLIFDDIYYGGGVIAIPFDEVSKSTYNDNEAIWETLGSIETTLDGLVDMPLDDSYAESLSIPFPLDKEKVDTWEQDRTDIDIKTKDEVKEEEQEMENSDSIEIPMDGIYENSSKLTDKFPFCIPWDVAKCVEGFKRSADPKVSFKIPFPYVGDFDINIDLSDYETPLTILRFFELLGFILGILILTRNHFTRG